MHRWFEELKRGDQVVHIYRTDLEQAKALLDLLSWLGADEKFVYLCDKWPTEGQGGSPLRHPVFDAAMSEARFEVLPAFDSFCQGGRLRPDSMLDIIVQEYDRAMDEGFLNLLIGWDGSWIAAAPQDRQAYAIHEAQLALAKLPHNLTLFCQYDARLLTPEQAEQEARMHQLVLSEGRLVRNFWVVSNSAWVGQGQAPGRCTSEAASQLPRKNKPTALGI